MPNIIINIPIFLFVCLRLCKSNGDKRGTKKDILRVFRNIQPNHVRKMCVFHNE